MSIERLMHDYPSHAWKIVVVYVVGG